MKYHFVTVKWDRPWKMSELLDLAMRQLPTEWEWRPVAMTQDNTGVTILMECVEQEQQ